MNKRKSTILGSIKKIIYIVMTAIFLILFCFIYLQYQTRHIEYEDKQIINIFGRQRMYTQMISKDSNRLYALLQAENTDYAYLSDKEIQSKITSVKESLSSVRESFSETLNAIHKNKITITNHVIHIDVKLLDSSENLKKIDELWVKFDQAAKVMAGADKIDERIAEAAIYINE